MVLQRDAAISLWGWANLSKMASIQFKNAIYHGRAKSNGKWQIDLPAQPAGGSFTMTIISEADTIQLKDIVFGDVWLCNGQSNMEHDLARVYERYAHDGLPASPFEISVENSHNH